MQINNNRHLTPGLGVTPEPVMAHSSMSVAWNGMVACLRAMGYIIWRRWLRRIRGVSGRPWGLLVLILAAAAVAAGEIAVLRQTEAAQSAYLNRIDLVLRLAPLLLALVIGRATVRSPLRLTVADISWLLTAPGGTRAAFVWKLLARPLLGAVIGYLGTVLSHWWLGLPLGQAWKAALAGAIIALALRFTSFASYILTIRLKAGLVLRAVAGLWAIALIVVALVNVPGGNWIELRPVTDRLAIGLLEPAAASVPWLLAFLMALLLAGAVLSVAARGFEERAETAARQAAQAQETMRRTRSGQELMAAQYRSGLPSLPVWHSLSGERALFYRVLAQDRRIAGASLATLAVFMAIALVLRLFLPAYAWVPAALTLVSAPTAAGAADGLAAELDHYHLRLVPFRPLPALLWVTIVPVVRTSIMVEILWLAAFAVPGLSLGAWIAGLVIIPFLVIQAATAGSLAIASAEGALSRIALGVGLSALGIIPAAALLDTSSDLLPAALLVVVAALTLLAAAAFWLLLTPSRVWAAR